MEQIRKHASPQFHGTGSRIPIAAYISTESFPPDIIANMEVAFANVCEALGSSYQRDAAADLIAIKVIELVRASETDVDKLTKKVMQIFGVETILG